MLDARLIVMCAYCLRGVSGCLPLQLEHVHGVGVKIEVVFFCEKAVAMATERLYRNAGKMLSSEPVGAGCRTDAGGVIRRVDRRRRRPLLWGRRDCIVELGKSGSNDCQSFWFCARSSFAYFLRLPG